jgi:hypothetical protein
MEVTFMERSNVVRQEHKVVVPQQAWPHWLQEDPRWVLAQRVVAGSYFSRSPLLIRFLLYVVAETLEGRGKDITEHQIGVHVFDRRAGYSTIEDNIVRNYARQLRKRLADFFAHEGSSESLRIDIPLGGYVPVFLPASEHHLAPEMRTLPDSVRMHTQPAEPVAAIPTPAVKQPWRRWLVAATALAVYSAALVWTTWSFSGRMNAPQPRPVEPAHALWAAMFNGQVNTYIVPADAGFNLLEDLSRRPLQLADYIKGNYLGLPLAGVDAHSADDLRSQHFTSFVDFQTVAGLAHLPEFNQERTYLRFPRDLRLDDLKNASAVLIGSVGSNPWASIAENNANFRIVYRQGMQSATIVNINPQAGEAASYVSHWNEPAHETYALIAFMPNLSGNGRLLLLQGLDVAGTQAAAETLFHPAAIAPILREATRPDGSLHFFEILLRSTSIDSNSTGTQVVASRIY